MVGAASRRTTPAVFSDRPSKNAREPRRLAQHSTAPIRPGGPQKTNFGRAPSYTKRQAHQEADS